MRNPPHTLTHTFHWQTFCLLKQAIHQETGVIKLPLSQYEEMEEKIQLKQQLMDDIQVQLEYLETEKAKLEESRSNIERQIREKAEEAERTKVCGLKRVDFFLLLLQKKTRIHE
jgi:septal ring factor EnvC (AmiA/AmiB activator)